LKFPENTLELIELDENLVLNDTYNLSEWWLLAWVETMNSFKNTEEKILVIDDILELWEKSKDIHFKIWKKLARNKLVTKVFFVWVNYKENFVNGLIDWWLRLSDIVNNLEFVGKNDILLFEWRKAKLELNKFLWEEE
jgi:hypothetical protein